MPYYIQNYDIKVNVLDNNSLEVDETIDAVFNQNRHGIFRYIPVKNKIGRTDGTVDTVYAKIKNVSINEKYDSYYDDYGNYVLQIGDEDKTIKGSHQYNISYVYKMGKDVGVDFDELYYNIIGDGWDTYIDNITFSVTMPKPFDESLVGISSGKYGTSGTEKVSYYVDGNTIYGSAQGFSSNEALTLRLELPEGYFEFNALAYYFKHALMIFIPLVAFICVLILWSKYGKDKKIVDVVEFYPPEGLSSAEMAFWYKGNIAANDTIGLLIELANEGYIRIDDCGYNGVKIIKNRDYDGLDENKRIFFRGLFEKRSVVSLNELEEKFYVHIDKIVRNISNSSNYTSVFNENSLKMRMLGWLISIAAGVISFFVFMSGFATPSHILCLGIGFAIAVVSFLFSFFIRQRTDKGHEIKQKINGFKIFIETAEKERLETLVSENPAYFYNILPYAYVLGVSDKWIKQFESIAIEPPVWYIGNDFNTIRMFAFINYTMRSASHSLTSAPERSSSGGGFSSGGGGGFAGGGVGGGGGGSW